jgi:hypothetical protein
MSSRAFTLREDAKESFADGSVTYGGDGRSANVKELLDAGGGVIVTEHPQLLQALEGFPALKETSAPDGAAPVVLDEKGRVLRDVQKVDRSPPKDELLSVAADEGVDVPDGATKAEIADAVDAAREGGYE